MSHRQRTTAMTLHDAITSSWTRLLLFVAGSTLAANLLFLGATVVAMVWPLRQAPLPGSFTPKYASWPGAIAALVLVVVLVSILCTNLATIVGAINGLRHKVPGTGRLCAAIALASVQTTYGIVLVGERNGYAALRLLVAGSAAAILLIALAWLVHRRKTHLS